MSDITYTLLPRSSRDWEGTAMEASFFLFILFLQGALVVATHRTCVFPNFSHKDEVTLSWIEKRVKDKQPTSQNKGASMNWSSYGKFKHRWSKMYANTSWQEFDQFKGWLSKDDDGGSHKFSLQKLQRFKIKNEVVSNMRNDGPIAVSALSMEKGDVLLELSLDQCISDKVSKDEPLSLWEAPWELRLASKLLRERSKFADSAWYPFIRLLPAIRLPMFFSESELDTFEEASILNEVSLLRSFAEASFRALHQHEISGSTFGDFVWALGVVYSFTCRVDYLNQKLEPFMDATHILIPFFGSYSDSLSAKATVQVHGSKVRLVMAQSAAEGRHLYLDHIADTSLENFLYRGFVSEKLPHDKAKVFESLQDLVKWYTMTYEQDLRLNEASLMTLVESTMQKSTVQSNNDLFKRKISPLSGDFSVGIDGYIDPQVVCALSILFDLNGSWQGSLDSEALELVDVRSDGKFRFVPERFILRNTSFLSNEAAGSVCGRNTSNVVDVWEKQALAYIVLVLRKRLAAILDSVSTLEEDEALLEASLWEGLSDDDGGSHLCETCQWQTEEISFNDFLALQFCIRKKKLLLHVLSTLSPNYIVEVEEHGEKSEIINYTDDADVMATEEFMRWCQGEGAQITRAIAVTHIPENSSFTGSSVLVRGVKALRDIEQGETICILPLKLGLFEKASSHLAGADSWHLAAAHLLQEKSLGVNSKWASYIGVLPKTMQSPIYLMPSELKEVHWWPVLRELIEVRWAIKKSFSRLTGPELAWADFEQYRWAVTMVHSRAFTLPVEDDEEYASYVLMPFMDMINHHFEYQADWMSLPVSDGKLEIIAKRHVHKGQELFASFGPRSNDNLFLYYGFVLENNPFDSAQVFSSFQDSVHWVIGLWGLICDEHHETRVAEECRQRREEELWVKARKAIDDYAAGITEQRPAWWKLVNTWADYGYEYMQFQPSPSIYAGGIVDPTLQTALEAVVAALDHDRELLLRSCKHIESDMTDAKSSMKDFFACLDGARWVSPKWALRSSLCSEYVCRAVSSSAEKDRTNTIVKLSLSLRCLEILKTFPTSIGEDKMLLREDNHSSIHVQLTRHYRYVKKLFLSDSIHSVMESD